MDLPLERIMVPVATEADADVTYVALAPPREGVVVHGITWAMSGGLSLVPTEQALCGVMS